MIGIKSLAEFRADFPDDMIEEDGEIVQSGGKAVAEALGEILTGLGCAVKGVKNAGDHGWDCSFSFERYGLWFQISDLDPYLLICKPPFGVSTEPRYLNLLIKLNDALRRDGRFHDLLWFTQTEFESGSPGSDIPVIGELPPPIEGKRSLLDKLFGR